MRTLRRSAAAALACALLAGGCGGEERAAEPQLPRPLAEGLAARSDAVAERLEAGDGCGARAEAEALHAEAVAAVDERRVPARYQEELVGSAAALVDAIACAPAPPAAPPPPPADDGDDEADDDGRGRGRRRRPRQGEEEGQAEGEEVVIPGELAGGRYVLAERLGSGGMALVLLGRDTALDRPVAVKLLADALHGDEEVRRRFLREGRLAAQLSHPNVVGVFDTGEEDGHPYIVMERVDGSTLAEELRARGPLPPDEAAALARQACAGLAHAHARGVVHRDVKPANLLLDRSGTLKVADFGIARAGDVSSTLTQAGTLLGTAAYMAPECARGEPATPASDVYGLGAVLYELVTGRPPREVTTIADLAREEPTPLPRTRVAGVPAALEAAIMRCLDPDPAARPSAAELATELDDPTAVARFEPPTEVLRAAPPGRRRAWLAAAAIAAVALLLGAAALDDDEPPPRQVEPVPSGSTAAEQARGLAQWLRENAAPEAG